MTAPNWQVRTELVRALGRWSLAALAINSVIGSGIFGLPSTVAGYLGTRSTVAVLIAGAAMAIIMACFAEVASQFSEAGGPYLYARTAFGRLIGILVGWTLYLAQTAAPAANANLFVVYLAEFWPRVKEPWPRFLILTLLVVNAGAGQCARRAAGRGCQQRVHDRKDSAAADGNFGRRRAYTFPSRAVERLAVLSRRRPG